MCINTFNSTLYNRLTLMSSSLYKVAISKKDHEFIGVFDLSPEEADVTDGYLHGYLRL